MKARWLTFHSVFVCRKTWEKLFARHQSNGVAALHLKRMYIVLDDLFFLVVSFFFFFFFSQRLEKCRGRDFSKTRRRSWLFACDQFLNGLDENRKFTADRFNTLPDWVRACWIYIGRFEGILCHRASSRFKIKANRIFFHDVWPRRSLVAGTKENYPPVINPHPRRYVLKTNSFERDLRVEFSFGNEFVNWLWKRCTIQRESIERDLSRIETWKKKNSLESRNAQNNNASRAVYRVYRVGGKDGGKDG